MTAFYRPTWAEISLDAFRWNLKVLRRLAPGARLMAVLKADGYGHGAAPLARAAAALPGARLWGFGVSSVEEGLALRGAGLRQPILILGSLFPFASFRPALENDLTPTVASLYAARALARAAAKLRRRAACHVKVDTGMGRIGMAPATALDVLPKILEEPSLRLEGLYTHLAEADVSARTREQLSVFDKLLQEARRRGVRLLAHAANSAAMLAYRWSHYDIVRPGLALFGAPIPGAKASGELKPVMTWKTRVVYLKTVAKGTPVSYGATYRAPRRSRLATLPVGYADGYRRAFSNKASVLLKGRRCPVVGRVTMDQTIVDVTGLPGVDVGEEAVLLGAQGKDRIAVQELADWAETIPYEIFCGVSARVPRVHL